MAPVRRKIIKCDKVCPTTIPLSQAVQVENTLYVSGQIGQNVKGEMADGMEAQARQVLTNIGHVLEAAGATFNHVVKVTVLLADINTFAVMNQVYAEFFKTNFPARAAYQVANLPRGALIEIEAVAIVGEIVEVK